MLPLVSVPKTIANQMENYRGLFCPDQGFEPVSRYLTGLIISPNKTLEGISALQCYDSQTPSRRVMHQAVFEAGWDSEALMQHHRAQIAADSSFRVATGKPKPFGHLPKSFDSNDTDANDW